MTVGWAGRLHGAASSLVMAARIFGNVCRGVLLCQPSPLVRSLVTAIPEPGTEVGLELLERPSTPSRPIVGVGA